MTLKFKGHGLCPWANHLTSLHRHFPIDKDGDHRKNTMLSILLARSHEKVKVLVAQSCPTLCYPMDCSPLGSSVHRILQARILEWVAMPFSRGSSWSRDWTWVSCIAGWFFTVWATREALISYHHYNNPIKLAHLISILKIRNLNFKEIQSFAQDGTAISWPSWDLI